MAGRHTTDWYYEWNWWSPEQICREWTKPQVEWLLYHLPEVRKGHWPQNPDSATGYVDPMLYRPKRKPYKAIMEGIIQTGAILQKRLEKYRLDGLITEANITWDKSVEALSRMIDMSEKEIIERIDNTIKYLTSFGRK